MKGRGASDKRRQPQRRTVMKIGAMLHSFRKPTFRENVEAAAALKLDGVQVLVQSDLPMDTVHEYLDIIKSNGMVVSALCGDIGGAYDTPEEVNRKLPIFKRILELSVAFECGIVTTHIGAIPENNPATYDIMFNACREMAEHAKSVGAKFAIETGPEKAAVLRAFLDDIGMDSAGVNLDPANLVMCVADDPAKAAEILKPYIFHTHAKDGIKTGETSYLEVPLGQGGVHFDTYLPALYSTGFDGFLTIEREVGDQPERDIQLATDFLREMTARYGI